MKSDGPEGTHTWLSSFSSSFHPACITSNTLATTVEGMHCVRGNTAKLAHNTSFLTKPYKGRLQQSFSLLWRSVPYNERFSYSVIIQLGLPPPKQQRSNFVHARSIVFPLFSVFFNCHVGMGLVTSIRSNHNKNKKEAKNW